PPRALRSFPPRRSSDLQQPQADTDIDERLDAEPQGNALGHQTIEDALHCNGLAANLEAAPYDENEQRDEPHDPDEAELFANNRQDRKSTRLNSSHVKIS